MEKNVFQADDTLIQILFRFGFIDTTSFKNKGKGKKSFKLSIYARKEIYFNGSIIEIINGGQLYPIGSRINEEQLKQILLFFYLNSVDYKTIDRKGYFDLKIIHQRLSSIQEYIDIEAQPGLYPKVTKVERRILNRYKALTIN